MTAKALSKDEFMRMVLNDRRRKFLRRSEAENYCIEKFKVKRRNGVTRCTK